jgi:acetyl-CoA carboxylase carboxyltransferase component
VEDGLLANTMATDLPADGVVTGVGRSTGGRWRVMANDPTVKAGSWGARTVEKIVRLTEYALRHELPVFWLVDSAGARITDQVELFPGRRGAGRIFYNQVRLSGRVPQICCLFGPSAAGGAYIPSFCDIVIMVEGNASMYLGLAPHGRDGDRREVATLEETGGARMHATVSGCGDNLAVDDEDAIEQAKAWFTYFPSTGAMSPRSTSPRAPAPADRHMVPADDKAAYDVQTSSTGWSTPRASSRSSRCSLPSWSCGLGLDGRSPGRVRGQQPLRSEGRVLFTDSADKAARFVWCCDAFNIPLVFLADVPAS